MPNHAAGVSVDISEYNSICPVGTIALYPPTSSPPTSWLWCDGASYLKADYPDLDDVLAATSYTYGSDSTHFNVPNKADETSPARKWMIRY